MEIEIFVSNTIRRFERKFPFRDHATPTMGASTSSEPKISAEQQEAENVASSTGALPILQKAFSKFASSETNAIPLENLQVLLANFINFLTLNIIYLLLDFLTCNCVNSLFSAMLRFRSRRSKLHYRKRDRFVSGDIGSLRFILS